jgi:hypothetical protein
LAGPHSGQLVYTPYCVYGICIDGKKKYEVRQQNRKAIESRALWADHWPGSAFSLSNLQIAISKLICPQDSCRSTFRRFSCQSNF